MGIDERGGEEKGASVSYAWSVWYGAFLAVIGGALVGTGALWISLTSGIAGGVEGVLVGFFRYAGPVGLLLTTGSLGGVFMLLVQVRSPQRRVLGTLGAFVALLSLLALVWAILHQSMSASDTTQGISGGVGPAMASWGRSISLLIFGAAALAAGELGRWGILLPALGILELPLFAGMVFYLLGPAPEPGWPVILLGIPGVQPGVIGAAAWILLGYALFEAGLDYEW